MSRVLTSNNLTDTDKSRAVQLASWFKQWKKQGRKPITQAELIKKLKETVSWEYTRHSFPALINYIRMELHICIASSNEGLYFADTITEKEEFKEYYESLIMERLKVLNWIKKDIAEDKKANQAEMFVKTENVVEDKHRIINEIETRFGGVRV